MTCDCCQASWPLRSRCAASDGELDPSSTNEGVNPQNVRPEDRSSQEPHRARSASLASHVAPSEEYDRCSVVGGFRTLREGQRVAYRVRGRARRGRFGVAVSARRRDRSMLAPATTSSGRRGNAVIDTETLARRPTPSGGGPTRRGPRPPPRSRSGDHPARVSSGLLKRHSSSPRPPVHASAHGYG